MLTIVPPVLPAAGLILPLEGALHFLLLLVGLFDLVGDPRQELFKIGQEVRLVPPQLSPKAAHLLWTEGEGGGLKHHANAAFLIYFFLTHSSKTLLAPRLSSSMQKCLSSSSSTADSLASHWL